MTILQKMSMIVFSVLFAFAVAFSYLINSQVIERPLKPWHMQPSIDADSLTDEYACKYELLDKKSLLGRFADTSRVTVAILIDAWGVPFYKDLLADDFAIFREQTHKEFLHRRLANRTRHAEFAELRTNDTNAVYLFGGDSLEYGRNLYIDSLGYGTRVFCQKCSDSVMLAAVDSVLYVGKARTIALTTQNSRAGERAKLHATLRLVAEVAKKYPKVQFIVQGTHRPTLGDPKIRRESFAHWVPAVVLN